MNLDVECIYIGDADPFGADIYFQYVVGWNTSSLFLEGEKKIPKKFLKHAGPFMQDFNMNKQIKMLDLSECDLNKLYSMLSHSHYINHPAFYNIKEHLIKMENTNSKFEIEEILGLSPEFIYNIL